MRSSNFILELELEREKKLKIQETKIQIQNEISDIIKQLVHPQTKEYYDNNTEDKIVSKSK